MKINKIINSGLILLSLNSFVVANSYAQDRVENGGSLNEAAIVSERIRLEETVSKIIHFFERTPELAAVFPEVNIAALIALKNQVNISVVEEDLFDRENSSRACLNSESRGHYFIKCQLSKLRQWQNPQDIFVLVMHELLGLLGLELSSVLYSDLRSSYPISSRLYRYVVQSANYDLNFNANAEREDRYENTFSTIYQSNEGHSIPYFDPETTDEGRGIFRNSRLITSGSGITRNNLYVGFSRVIRQHRISSRRQALANAKTQAINRCERVSGRDCVVIKVESDCSGMRSIRRNVYFHNNIDPRSCVTEDNEFGEAEVSQGPSRCLRQQKRAKLCGAYAIATPN